ncbi:hypothetical protein [Chryseobacterium sp. FH1]|uniref:hypothetical protein n=1 Tax=Chryseobacterium sp. FH1 TaxID=1233951 RepID=UPI0010389739|nr:hypothetical protein [Chryseobacterium sp. FH1]
MIHYQTKLCLVAFLCIKNLVYSQEKNLKFLDDDTNLYLETNINFSSSTEDSRSDAQAGIVLLLTFLKSEVVQKWYKYTNIV